MTDEKRLIVEHLDFAYGGKNILDDIGMTLTTGEVVALV